MANEDALHVFPNELILKIMSYDQVTIKGINTLQPSSTAVGLGLANSKYYKLLKRLFPSIIIFGDDNDTSEVDGIFLGPKYHFLRLVGEEEDCRGVTEASEAVRNIFGLRAIYGPEYYTGSWAYGPQ